MTTILISILSGILGLTIGYALGRVNRASCAVQFGEWNICGFKGILNPDIFYLIAKNNKVDVSLLLYKNGDVKYLLEENRDAK